MIKTPWDPKIVSQQYNEFGELEVDIQRSSLHKYIFDSYEPKLNSIISHYEKEMNMTCIERKKKPENGVTDRLVFI